METLTQQTTAWLEWRRGKIGASDAPIILGVSPWKTRYQLWLEKSGKTPLESGTNYQQQRGIDLEPKARAFYELYNDCDMPPTLVEHSQYPFLAASMDGYNHDLRRGLEIKCPGKADHDTALAGKIPDKYWPQVQHQLLVTGAEQIDYVSFDGERGTIVEVKPDREYMAMLLNEEMKFWALVQQGIAPELSEQDFKEITDPALIEKFQRWRDCKLRHMQIDEMLERYKSEILEHVDHPRIRCAGVQVVKNKKGVVQLSIQGGSNGEGAGAGV